MVKKEISKSKIAKEVKPLKKNVKKAVIKKAGSLIKKGKDVSVLGKKSLKKGKVVIKKEVVKTKKILIRDSEFKVKNKAKAPIIKVVKVKPIILKSLTKEKKVGRVIHYFDKIKVVAVKLLAEIEVGEVVRLKGGKETDFKQKIVTMEVGGEKIKKARKGQEVGFKVREKVRVGYWVYRIQ